MEEEGLRRYLRVVWSLLRYMICQQDKEHWQMPFEDIAKELGIQAARSTHTSIAIYITLRDAHIR